jgi:hypothetical protein
MQAWGAGGQDVQCIHPLAGAEVEHQPFGGLAVRG